MEYKDKKYGTYMQEKVALENLTMPIKKLSTKNATFIYSLRLNGIPDGKYRIPFIIFFVFLIIFVLIAVNFD